MTYVLPHTQQQENLDAWFKILGQSARQTCLQLCKKAEILRESETIYPAQGNILNALKYTPPAQVKAVILGQDPYHTPGCAQGLAFAVPEGTKLPPSLRNIYKELAADMGLTAPKTGDISPWAAQGVLLLNAVLTVREHAAASHANWGWQAFTSAVVQACFELAQPVVFFAWGSPAAKVIAGAKKAAQAQSACVQKNKFILNSTHPSPLSANRATKTTQAFLGSKPFSRANELLLQCGSSPINWACVCE